MSTWRKCCRKLLGLNPRTRSHLIPHIMGTAPIYDIVMYRMLNFIIDGINHQDNIVNSFFKNSLLSNTSYMSSNLSRILKNFNLYNFELFSLNKNKLKIRLNERIEEKDWQFNIVEELMYLRESGLETKYLDRAEINTMLNNVSIL